MLALLLLLIIMLGALLLLLLKLEIKLGLLLLLELGRMILLTLGRLLMLKLPLALGLMLLLDDVVGIGAWLRVRLPACDCEGVGESAAAFERVACGERVRVGLLVTAGLPDLLGEGGRLDDERLEVILVLERGVRTLLEETAASLRIKLPAKRCICMLKSKTKINKHLNCTVCRF